MRRALARVTAAAAAFVLASASLPVAAGAPAAAPRGAAADTMPLTLTVVDVSPSTPPIVAQTAKKPRPITFRVRVENTTDATISGIRISATRSDPIANQSQLSAALKSPKAPSDSLRSDIKTDPVMVPSLAAGADQTVIFATTIGPSSTNPGICQCANLIYPIYFTASVTSGTTSTEVGHTQTYLPSFTSQPAKMKVAWLWPLLDRPHRLKQYDLFTDDDLATELAPNGRLTKLLRVLEAVADPVDPRVDPIPVTVVTDPDLIDSLAVMASSSGYRVQTSRGVVRGTNGQLAADWLSDFRAVLSAHPNDVQLAFTAFADPAVQALTNNRLTWSTTADTSAQSRISAALGAVPVRTDITWPDHERLDQKALTQLVRSGTTTVVLRDLGLTKGTATVAGRSGNKDDNTTYQVPADAVAPLQTAAGPVVAAVTSNPLEQLITRILTSDDGAGLDQLPALVAQLAVRVENSFTTSHVTLLAPPRSLTVADPAVAISTIRATARTVWSEPVAFTSMVTRHGVGHGTLKSGYVGPSLATETVDAIRTLDADLPIASGLFADAETAQQQLGDMPAAAQRTVGTTMLTNHDVSANRAKRLRAIVTGILGNVRLARLYQGTKAVYTFASKDASLPVTVVNGNSFPVRILVHVFPKEANEKGLSVTDMVRPRLLNSGQRVQLKVGLHLKRVGQIKVMVQLENADRTAIGSAHPLNIRSTALGTIGIVITVVAGVVLGLAVALRLTRRALHRRRTKAAAA